MKKLLQMRSLTLIVFVFFVVQFSTVVLHPDLTYARATTYSELQSSDPLTVDETENGMVANCRYGVTNGDPSLPIVTTVGAGVSYRFGPEWWGPMPANGAELLRMIRVGQDKTATGQYLPSWYPETPLDENLADIISSNPGTLWIIGNEIERGPNPGEIVARKTDDIYADIYAEAYHAIYQFIKDVDPTARVGIAGLIQITPMRLQYLNLMWDAYVQKYGGPMPVDVYTIHAYVMPELTADGQPNAIAGAALGTNIALGKRQSGWDGSKCPLDDVYCHAEHDDLSLLGEQVVSMRQWMKDHGEQDKPLIVSEYGTIYQYTTNPDGTCSGLFDEFGQCFTPERVSAFMQASFDYFNGAIDPALGMPLDDNRLVQQWIWYGAYEWDIGSSNLLESDRQTLTLMGETFRDQVFIAESEYVNLVVENVSGTAGTPNENGIATAELRVDFRNNGNATVDEPFTVAFYQDAALTQLIGSATVTPVVRGCATKMYTATIDWQGVPAGTHPFWVKIDSGDVISESDESDNFGSSELTIAGDTVSLSLPVTEGAQFESVQLPLAAANVQGLTAAELTIVFDPAILDGTGATTGDLTSGWSLLVDDSSPGELSLNMSSPGGSVSGSGVLANLEFDILGASGSSTDVQISMALLNGGTVPATITNGRVDVSNQGEQTINLNAGWNMISSYIDPIDPAIENLLPAPDVTVCKDGDGYVYWPGQGINTIINWRVGDGYQCYYQTAKAIQFSGNTIVPEATPLSLPAGWSIIAYLRGSAMAVDQAAATVSPQLVMVKNNAGQVYWPEYNIDQIVSMQPGQGYQIYLAEPGTLTYPAN